MPPKIASCLTTSRSARSSRAGSPPLQTYAWYVGNIWEVNRRRTKSENVSVEFDDDTYGETRGMFVAAAETYGTDKLWVVLKPIPIELDSSPHQAHPDSSCLYTDHSECVCGGWHARACIGCMSKAG